MNRRYPVRLVMVATLIALFLLPSLALAADGSDTSAFERYASQSPIVAAGMSFAFGFISALTPCVFPMVPITVAIFGATESQSRLRGAALSATFVLGIACLFTPLGIGAALSGKLMGSALSNPWVVGVLALVSPLIGQLLSIALPAVFIPVVFASFYANALDVFGTITPDDAA